MQRYEQYMPRPLIYPKQLIPYPCTELCELVQAARLEVGTVDELAETVIAHRIEPAGEIGNEAGLSGRQVYYEQQQP